MRCPQCRTENEKNAQFCSECGTVLAAGGKAALVCPSCGEGYTEKDAFCQNCGHVLTDKGAPRGKTTRGKLASRDERYHLARQLALKKISKDDRHTTEPAPIIYIGEKII